MNILLFVREEKELSAYNLQSSKKQNSEFKDTHFWRREVNRGGRSSTAEFKFIRNSSLKLSLKVSVNSLSNAERLKARS